MLKSYKIDVRDLTIKQKKDVQRAFFKLGYKWAVGDLTELPYLDKGFYYADSEGYPSLCYGNEEDYFYGRSDVSDYRQLTYTELMVLAGGDNTTELFTKPSLKDGMFVRLRNGKIFILTQGNLLNGSGWMNLESYSVDLKHTYDDSWSIVEVMELKHDSKKLGSGFSKIEDFEYNSIWKRPEQTQQQKQLAELKTSQEELLLQAREIADKIDALHQSN